VIDSEARLHEDLERLVPLPDARDASWSDALARADRRTGRRLSLRRRGGRVSWLRFVVAAAVAVALVAVFAGSHWTSSQTPSLVDRALAAVGSGPVIHAVIATETGMTSIDLASGREAPVVTVAEVWFDRNRQIEHTVSRIAGQLQNDRLVTPSRVSELSGSDTKGPPPVLDPALAKSIDGYRDALATGDAKVLGEGSVDGRAVTWLELHSTSWGDERVAIDKRTWEPVRVETSWNGHRDWAYDVRSIETLPEGAGDFDPPASSSAPRPLAFMREPAPTSVEHARDVLPDAEALGSSFAGLALTQVSDVKLSTVFEADTSQEPVVSHAVEFDYGSESLMNGGPYLWLEEAAHPQPQYGWYPSLVPTASELLVSPRSRPPGSGTGWSGLMVDNGIYITILASDRALMLDAAHALVRPGR
jgi:hypothetical protein